MSRKPLAAQRPTTRPRSRNWLQAVADNDVVCRFTLDEGGHLVPGGADSRLLLGLDAASDVAGVRVGEVVHPEDRGALREALTEVVETPDAVRRVTFRLVTEGPAWRSVEGVAERLAGVLTLNVWDVTNRKRRENRSRREARLLQILADHDEEVVLVIGPDYEVAFVSRSASTILGLAPDRLTVEAYLQAVDEPDRQRVSSAIAECRGKQERQVSIEYQMTRPDGARIVVASTLLNRMADHGIRGVVVHTRDITAGKHRDPLTGLWNRTALLERIDTLLTSPDKPAFALMLVRIDRFDFIAGGLGGELGDEMLVQLGERLVEAAGPTHEVARIESERFAILLTNIDDAAHASRVGADVQERVRRPFKLDDAHEIAATASIGIAIGPRRYDSARQVLHAAETAVLTAKERGQATPATFDTEMIAGLASRLWIERDLRHAIARRQLEVHYQPIMNLRRQRLGGFEALVRWRHPERGLIPPAKFIPIAEQCGLIRLVGEWVLGVACSQLATWHEMYPVEAHSIFMNVNLSAAQLAQGSLVDDVAALVAGAGIQPHHLKLEVTETSLIADPDMAHKTLHQLRELGVRLALDDFGTGYSSLRHLHSYPFDTLKVDRQFINDLTETHPNDDKHLLLVRTILKLGESLRMDVVAEGIETVEQLRMLHALDCGYGQGYLFSKALPADEIASFFNTEESGPG